MHPEHPAGHRGDRRVQGGTRPRQDRRQHRLHPAQLRGDEQAVGAHAAPGALQGARAQGKGEDGAQG